MTDTRLLAELCAAVSVPTMTEHLEEFARRVKLSGTAEELESFRYLQARMDAYGFETDLIQHDAYISLPGRARIEIDGAAPHCITHSFSRSSPPGGIRARVVYGGAGTPKDLAGIEVAGNILLLEGIANPAASLAASQAGAVGQIHICPVEHTYEMCISPVWGSPTPAELDRLPKTVVVSLRRSDGDALKARVRGGERVEATLQAEVDTRWRKTPILEANLRAPQAATEDFVLFSGHHDTWYYGVMDNGSANAAMLEVARLLAPRRDALKRHLRLCFWSGHSHGRYSGSSWYADTKFDELEASCVAHVNIDSVGAKGNTVLSDALTSNEFFRVAEDAIARLGGQSLDGHRMSRAGDQSFWGIGIPSVFMAMGEQPAGSADSVMGPAISSGSARKGAGFGWWWHTPDDLIDKIDPELLKRDTSIYVDVVGRLLTDMVLPIDVARQAASLAGEIGRLAGQLEGRLDVAPLLARLVALRASAEALGAQADAAPAEAAERINAALVAATRSLVPIDYTNGDRFAPDPALRQNAYPVLDPVRVLVGTGPDTDAARHAMVGARRALNRVSVAVAAADAAIRSAST